jgi:aminopeptidase N
MSSKVGFNVISKTEAEVRANSVRPGVQYDCFFHFQKGENYEGLMTVVFQLTDNENIFLDYSGKSISHLEVNGTVVASPEKLFISSRIHIPQEHLRVGHVNVVTVRFQNSYFHDGNGLHSFTDVDDKQYLYTQSEPFWGNRVWPIFDQPDLKGNLTIHAAAPSDWLIITSTEACQRFDQYEQFTHTEGHHSFQKHIIANFPKLEGHSYWRFNPSISLSTYLYNIVCGPFRRIDLEESKRYNHIPMAIYCRDSLLKFAEEQAHNIFEFHKQGIKRYDELFNLPYPFGKCDALFCPEFTVGAMEYPGAITYTEKLLPREHNTVNMVSLRGSVILHELAHMWFGNTVTMKWWDDLWLNESFADFVCYQNWADIRDRLDFETYDPWLQFMTRKGWGYKEDQESTTHPIAGEVINTEKAECIFDGITYSKGAATMRQLLALVGEERFFKALGKYFRKFQFRNTKLSDLIESLEEQLSDEASAGQTHKAYDLRHWEKSWLCTAGLNTVRAEWKVGGGQQVLSLHQGAAMEVHPTLRFHRINVAFFRADGTLGEEKEIILEDQAVTQVEFDAKDYVAVLPNYRDFAFIKIVLDEASASFFKSNFNKLTDPLTKGLILRSFYDGVRDATVKTTDFLSLCFSIIDHEQSIQILDLMYGYVGAALSIVREANMEPIYSKMYKLTRAKLLTFTEPATIRSMLQKLIGYARAPEDVEDLHLWLAGKNEQLSKYELAVGDKWSIVFKMHGVGKYSPEVLTAIYDKTYAEDSSDTKKSSELKIKALSATDEERKTLFAEYFNPETKLSYKDMESSLSGFGSSFVPLERRKVFFDQFFSKITAAMRERTKEVGSTLYYGFLPSIDDHDYKIAQLSEIVKDVKPTEIFLTKAFNQSLEELHRIKKARLLDPSA